MPEYFEYLRFAPTSSSLSKSPQIGDQEKETYDRHNQDVRKNEQFKKIAAHFSYDPNKIGYLIERDGDQYWIRLIENQSDPGKRFAPDPDLRAILKKFYETDESNSDPLDPPIGSTPMRPPETPISPPSPIPKPLDSPKRPPTPSSPLRSPPSPTIEPFDPNSPPTPIVGFFDPNDRSQASSPRTDNPDSTPTVGFYDPTNDRLPASYSRINSRDSTPSISLGEDSRDRVLPPSRRVRFGDDVPSSHTFGSRAWNTLTGSASSQNIGSPQRREGLSFSNPIDELYAPLRAQEEENVFAPQISLFAAENSSRSSAQIDPASVTRLKEDYEELQRKCEELEAALEESESAEKTIEDLQNQLSVLKKTNMQLANTLDEYSHVDPALEQVQESERTRHLLEEIDRGHDLEIQELSLMLEELKRANFSLREEIDAAEAERRKTADLLSRQTQLMSEMASEIERLQKSPELAPPQRNEPHIEPALPDMSLIRERDDLLAAKDDELSALGKEVAASSKMLQQKEAQIADLQDLLESNSKDLESLREALSLADKTHKESSRQLHQQLVEAAAEIQYLKEKQQSLEDELEQEHENPELLQNEIRDLKRTLAQRERELETWAADGEDWKSKISVYKEQRDNEVAHLKELNAGLEGRLSAAVQKQQELTRANAEYAERLAEPLYAEEKSKEEIASLREQLEETQIQLKEAEARCEEANRVYTAARAKFGEMNRTSREKEAKDAKELRRLESEILKLQDHISRNTELLDRMDTTLSDKELELQGANETIAALEINLRELQEHLTVALSRRRVLLGDLTRAVRVSQEEKESPPPLLSQMVLIEDLGDTAPAAPFSGLINDLPDSVKVELNSLWEKDRALLEAADEVRLVDGSGRFLSYSERSRPDATLALIRDGNDQSLPQDASELQRPLETILHNLKAMSHQDAQGDILTSGRLSPRTNELLHNINRSFQNDSILQRLSDSEDRSNRKSLILAAHFLCNYIVCDDMRELYPLAEELIDLATSSQQEVPSWLAVKFRSGIATQHLVRDLFFLDAMYNLKGEESRLRPEAVKLRQQLLENGLLPALRRMLN